MHQNNNSNVSKILSLEEPIPPGAGSGNLGSSLEPAPPLALVRCRAKAGKNLQTCSRCECAQWRKSCSFCFYCGCLGHLNRSCDKITEDITKGCPKETLYGNWLKASELQFFSAPSPSDSPSQNTAHPQSPQPSKESLNHTSEIPNPQEPSHKL
ncbi:zinc knuckle protein [Striga asiatica]|uniref:Zinc knuckle protein n=1 Tax=Striga asiatica TaxID=4170 RepID=A0A5A7PWM3_STRAF|nr:zinc knuckle protein [Striga asiatica]